MMDVHTSLVAFLLCCHTSSHYCDTIAVPFGDNVNSRARRADTDDTAPCIGCKSRPRRDAGADPGELERFRQFQIELNKMKLLSQLRLERPPQVSEVPPLPDFLQRFLTSSEDHLQADDPGHQQDAGTSGSTIDSIAIPGHGVPDLEGDILNSRTFNFHLTASLLEYKAKMSELWLQLSSGGRNLSSPTLYVSETQGRYRRIQELPGVPGHIVAKARFSTAQLTGWIRYDVSSVVRKWLRHSHINRTLTVTCLDCTDLLLSSAVSRTLLVVQTQGRRRQMNARGKRTACLRSERCCKESLYIDFKSIGWSNWILVPSGYQANYCVGSCTEPHVSLYGNAMRLQHDPSHRMTGMEDMLPCCAAASMSSLTILYVNDDHEYRREILDDMTVNTCDCR